MLRFHVNSEFLRKYAVRTVGAAIHREYWIPAAEMEESNNIAGLIESIACLRK